jgi:hypothetical protein
VSLISQRQGLIQVHHNPNKLDKRLAATSSVIGCERTLQRDRQTHAQARAVRTRRCSLAPAMLFATITYVLSSPAMPQALMDSNPITQSSRMTGSCDLPRADCFLQRIDIAPSVLGTTLKRPVAGSPAPTVRGTKYECNFTSGDVRFSARGPVDGRVR